MEGTPSPRSLGFGGVWFLLRVGLERISVRASTRFEAKASADCGFHSDVARGALSYSESIRVYFYSYHETAPWA